MSEVISDYVYMDYAATSPLCEEALAAMQPFMVAGRGGLAGMNPNALSTPGRDAFKSLEGARRDIAAAVGAARPDEIIFTSGATEADNAALFGMAKGARENRRSKGDAEDLEVIVSAIEHDAVLEAAKALERDGFKVIRLRPDRDGFIENRSLEDAITSKTILVSIQMANSEIGSIQPIRQLAMTAHEHGVLFHTDATQALGKIAVDVKDLGVDAASFSSHKIGGPKGVGALYLRARTPFMAHLVGGGQEGGKRSGTQNVAGAVGFAAACKSAIGLLDDEAERLRAIRDRLYHDLASFERIQPTVDVEEGSLDYLPNIVNVMVSGLESETLVIRFDSLGIAVSGGSACASRSLDASHVLTSLGIRPDEALGELRISLGRYTTEDDASKFLRTVSDVLEWERR